MKFQYLSLLAIWTSSVLAQAPAVVPLPLDTLLEPQQLPGAEVTVARTEVYATIPTARVNERAIQRFGASDLTPALNRVPGVRFESRAPGSYRVLIRGTGRRSPFGVRDVRVYWNGLQLSEPGGDTPLNFVALGNIDQVDVGKGPNDVSAGSPLGGTLYLNTRAKAGAQANVQVGSYGQRVLGGTVGLGRDSLKPHVEIRVNHRTGDNYRDHSALRRSTAQLSIYSPVLQSITGEGWRVRTNTHALATRLDYELPGALTAEQFAGDPTQARAGSAEAQAAIDYENVLVGTTIEAERQNVRLYLTPQLSGFRFDNPFNVNHKRETNVGLGARAGGSYRVTPGTELAFGGEVQAEFRDSRQYDPDGGSPGDLQYADDIQTERFMAFAQVEGNLGSLRYSVGASVTQQDYAIQRTFERGSRPTSAGSDFAPFFAPRAALTYTSQEVSVTASVAQGTSAPTLREFRTNEGSLNTQLKPERGTSAEIFAVYRPSNRFSAQANAYYTRLSETITTFQDVSQVQLFRNSGSARQPGLELAAEWFAFRQNAAARSSEVSLSPAYSFQPYRYLDYEVDGVSFAGRPMAGVPEHTLDVLLHGGYGFRQNLVSLDFNVRYESVNPLNDAGTVVADAFVVMRLQASYDLVPVIAGKTGIRVSGGVDNLGDVRYSLGNDINPQFGNRYYQPAPGRNYFLRAEVRI